MTTVQAGQDTILKYSHTCGALFLGGLVLPRQFFEFKTIFIRHQNMSM